MITAAYQSSYTLATIISGDKGGTVDIFLGICSEGSSEEGKNVKEIFEKQLQGIYPGKGIEFVVEDSDKRIVKDRLEELGKKKHGGILTGIPTQKIGEEKQTFDLSSVIRSMNGQEFLLTTISRPVKKLEAAQQLHELMELKDQCHLLANRTIGSDKNVGANQSHADQEAVGKSDSHGFNLGIGMNPGSMTSVPKPPVYNMARTFWWGNVHYNPDGGSSAFCGLFLHKNKILKPCRNRYYPAGRRALGEIFLLNSKIPLRWNWKISQVKLITRLRNGLNTGIWESFITYATTSSTASQILSGTLAGELIKADPEALPVRNVFGDLSEEVPLLIPKERDGESLITGNKLVSFLSSDEASTAHGTAAFFCARL